MIFALIFFIKIEKKKNTWLDFEVYQVNNFRSRNFK